jgi:hypothetical protein
MNILPVNSLARGLAEARAQIAGLLQDAAPALA